MEIDIKDTGPVEEFHYEMEHPGLHVLRGKAGAGKTTILRTVQLAVDGRVDTKPTKRDGTKKGEATIAGKTLKISRTIREEGELGVEGLGDLDVANLHTPKFQEPTTRDKHRIKTLVRLAGVKADPALFYPIVGGKEEFDRLVTVDAIQSDDLVEMAAKMKRCLEKHAQDFEKKAETALSNRSAKQDQVSGVDLDAPSDEKALAEALRAAIEKHTRLKTQREKGQEVLNSAAKAKEELAKIESGRSIDEIKTELSNALQAQDLGGKLIQDLERQLAEAKVKLAAAEKAVASARELLQAAERQQEIRSKWETQIREAEQIEVPTEEFVAKAKAEVDAANQAVVDGLAVRNAKSALEMADKYLQESKDLQSKARKLRGAAHDTQDVLTEAIAKIPNCPLKVLIDDDGDARLVIKTDRSEQEPFDELSDGQRWNAILPLCFQNNRLIVLSQAAFGEIQPKNVKLLDELARTHGAYILTAQVDDGQLRGESWSSNGKAVS